ncbi:MAG: hypothetical protein NZ730_07420 [Porticoccaceae bacterium]|nr:hypothetical protein [Porticoccaceae bacterium]
MTNSPIQKLLTQCPKPRELVLSALFASSEKTIASAQLISAGALMGLEESAIRVTLHRLMKDGDVVSNSRGSYSLGEARSPLYRVSQLWKDIPSLTSTWSGDWLTVHTAHLAKSDRTAKRLRERALSFYGFVQAVDGLWCRPNNLHMDTGNLCEELFRLGLERSAILTISEMVNPLPEIEFKHCWEKDALELGYTEGKTLIQSSLRSLEAATYSERARESFLLLNALFKFVASDPLLPSEFIDESLRNDFHDHLVGYHKFGTRAWTEFYKDSVL